MGKEPPKVTGLAPNAGPPGTKLTIRGENLGTGSRDLIGLTICGKDCLLSAEWKSAAKIICRSGPGIGKGDVIITTQSGGVGTCTVQFRGFMETIGPVKESAVWVDESILVNPVFARKRATSPSQLHPNDPLELSDELNEVKFPEDELLEMFSEGSGDLRMDNFIPSWFLLENHNGTSFDDLKSGLNCLRRKVSQHKEGPLSFLKANMQPVMDCLDTLSGLKNNVESYSSDDQEKIILKIENSITEARDGANSLFEEVLKRKDHADATRNALNVMQRFKFLFHLPCNIERNIVKADYGVVINDYTKAKSLFASTEIDIFRKVYEDVEVKIEDLRALLLSNLKILPCNLDELKKIIKCLVDLESPGDPAWNCIQYHYDWIGEKLKECRDSYIDQVQSEDKDMTKDEEQKNYRKDSHLLKGLECDDGIRFPTRVKFVSRINEIFSETFPSFWKLGKAYFSNQLTFKEVNKPLRSIDPIKQAAYNKMVLECLKFYCSLIRAALLPHTLSSLPLSEIQHYGIWPKKSLDSIGSWIPHCLRSIRISYASLIHLNLSCDALDILQELIFDLRVHSMMTLFDQLIEDVSEIHEREMWALEFDDENGGISQLPLLFENMIIEKVQLMKESILYTDIREKEIFSSEKVEDLVKMKILNVLTAFISSLNHLVSNNIKETNISVTMSNWSQKSIPDNKTDSSILGWERQLLVILNNCSYVVNNILPRFRSAFKKYGYPDVSSILKNSVFNYNSFDQKVFDEFIEKKCDPIIGAIEQNMYVGKFDYNRCPLPMAVRSYVKQVIMDIISVHRDVYSVSPVHLNRVMTRIVQLVSEEIARLYNCIPLYNDSGSLQARLDIFALQQVLSWYQSNESSNNFKECLDCMPLLNDPKDEMLLDTLFKKFQTEMQFQLLCFQSHNSSKG